ncbi:SDR family oxidoreductase, partial [Serratia marcescens]|uniref:SDR family oxidoreductase n=2 Tax=Gammaproteobacteria TaxID=1236 RepID=UPI0013DAF808
MNQPLKGKFAVVTGGSSGIGLAIARRLIDDGADVVITGRTAVKLNRAVMTLGEKANGVVTDVSSRASLDELYQQIKT